MYLNNILLRSTRSPSDITLHAMTQGEFYIDKDFISIRKLFEITRFPLNYYTFTSSTLLKIVEMGMMCLRRWIYKYSCARKISSAVDANLPISGCKIMI